MSGLEDPGTEPLTVRSLITTTLISPTPLLMKITWSEVSEGEVLLEIILATLRLRHWSLMATSNKKTTLIRLKPLIRSLNSRSIMMRKPLS